MGTQQITLIRPNELAQALVRQGVNGRGGAGESPGDVRRDYSGERDCRIETSQYGPTTGSERAAPQ
jgi:hypothetical protein